MRPGEDPRDIYWRKTAALGQRVMRERARRDPPRRHDYALRLRIRPSGSGDEWTALFERRIRDVASRAVAHIKRGDRVTIRTTSAGSARADRVVGADPLLRYLALLEATPAPTAQRASGAAE